MKTLLTLLVLAISFGSMGQSEFDERLLERYSEERIQHLQNEHSAVIEYWSFYLDNSYFILEGKKGAAQKQEGEVKIKDLNDFNILELKLRMARSENLAYRIKGTEQYLVMLSNEAFTKKLNRHRSQN